LLLDRRKTIAIVAVAVSVAVLGAAAYAYDSSRDDRIAEGITVAGVDVGGMSREAAARKLSDELDRSLSRPVRVRAAGRLFRLSAERAGVVVDYELMSDAAVERSRSAWIGKRVWRNLTGGRVDSSLPATVRYSRAAVRRFVAKVRRAGAPPARAAGG
jgi:hypothetical protein